jgi:hypothetical protein
MCRGFSENFLQICGSEIGDLPATESRERDMPIVRKNLRGRGGSVWAFATFLVMFGVLLWVVSTWYLLPALSDFYGGDEHGKRIISAQAWLLMALVLLILGMMMILLFKISRFFFPRPFVKREKTQYTDAWTEAGKRFKSPPDN